MQIEGAARAFVIAGMAILDVQKGETSRTGLAVEFVANVGAWTGGVAAPVEFIAGEEQEAFWNGLREVDPWEGARLFESEGWSVGVIDEHVRGDLAEHTHDVYRRVLRLAGDRRLARIWNYVPRINESGAGVAENYRAFCAGRSVAFEERFGADFCTRLPAASAVGAAEGRLMVVFAATRAKTEHFENPAQVPAYEYPPEHGPRPPSFARATRVTGADGRRVFVSGTAAIKGHVSIARNDLGGQIACTLDNLRVISRRCGLGGDLGAGEPAVWQRHFKVYLRRAEDYAAAARQLETSLLVEGDRVTWLRADICRRELLIEIEATVVER